MSLIQLTGGRVDRPVATTPEVAAQLAAGAAVAIGVSGGKDSSVCAFATVAHLDAIGHAGPRVLIHSDLGRVEWRTSGAVCAALADRLGVELVTVRRDAGDMMDRWHTRWTNNLARYQALSCVKLILPWSTPSMRFCTSELKTAIICRALGKRFPGRVILSASGIRRDESANRAKAPIVKAQAKLTSKARGTTGYDWHPILDWRTPDVIAYHRHVAFPLHEAYTAYGMTRVSCAFCIMSSLADLIASASCADNRAILGEMVDLEITSAFAFQGARWLGDVAPHLLTAAQVAGLARAKQVAVERERIEAAVPAHLLYTKGWPTCMPTMNEAAQLASIRREIAGLYGIAVACTDADSVHQRYADLMAANAARNN